MTNFLNFTTPQSFFSFCSFNPKKTFVLKNLFYFPFFIPEVYDVRLLVPVVQLCHDHVARGHGNALVRVAVDDVHLKNNFKMFEEKKVFFRQLVEGLHSPEVKLLEKK